jgi:hypothetical protein
MASLDNDLTLHLALDEIQGGLALDGSANDNDGAVKGDPQLVPDELFGSCFDFDGADDYVEIADPFEGVKDFTVAVWLKPAALDDGQSHGALGFDAKPSLRLAPSGGALQYNSSDAAQKQYADQLANFFTKAGEWVHAAWVKEAAEYRFYRGGQLFATREAPEALAADAQTGYYVGRADAFWKGQLSHARVYSRALTAEEIQQVMLDDQTAYAAFRKSHPIEFHAYDDDQQPVIVIDNGGPGKNLHFEIANSSQHSIELMTPASPTASPGNYHFALRFRPGAVSSSSLSRVVPAAAKLGWAFYQEPRADGAVSLYFLQPVLPEGSAAAPGQSIVLTLPDVSAEAAGGSRGTRVELSYSQLRYVGESAQLSGSRAQHLEIISERGKRNVPLHVGFLGSNRVLNDGQTANELKLRVTNTLAEDPIALSPDKSEAPTTFTLSFDVQGDGAQREWALGTSADVQNTHVSVVRLDDQGRDEVDTDWVAKVVGLEGETPEWELTTTKTALAAGEMFQVRLKDFVSSLPSGQTDLYVRYKNLPGYWDGQFVVAAEKSPLVTEGQRVGVGVTRPRSALDTGLGVLTGAAADYQRAQATLSGGGKVTWTHDTMQIDERVFEAGRLKWSDRFIAISMGGLGQSFKQGFVNIYQPTSNIPASGVWDGKDRSVNQSGVLLYEWEALYAVHRVGDGADEVEFRIVLYTSTFTAASNWLLVAVRNADDLTVRLGNGVTLARNSSSTNGSPIPSGTIMMWSGRADSIPDGWVLCDGGNGTPRLQDRFVVAATSANALSSGDADEHLHSYDIPPSTFTTTTIGNHSHSFPGWYKRTMHSYSAVEKNDYSLIDSNGNDPKSQTTNGAGSHSHTVTVDYSPLNTAATAAGRPAWFALCYIMKL